MVTEPVAEVSSSSLEERQDIFVWIKLVYLTIFIWLS